MSKNRRDKRINERNKIQPEKSSISKRSKIIWIGVVIIFILLICFLLVLKFIKQFIII